MMKNCVFDADGNLINIGDWDYQIRPVQIGTETVVVKEAIKDEEGNVIESEETAEQPVFEDQETNPFPEGATIIEKEVEQDEDGGWRIVGIPVPKTQQEEIDELKQLVADLASLQLGV